MRRLRFGIRPKLTLLFVLFAALILAGVGALAYLSGRAAIEQAVISDLESTANEKQAALDQWLDDRLKLVVSITEFPAYRARVNSLINDKLDDDERKTLQGQVAQVLAGFTGPNGNYTEMMIVEAGKGQVIVSTQPENQAKFNEDRLYFIEGKKGPFVQNVIYSLNEQVPMLVVSAPMKADDGRVIAVLAARLKLDEMNKIILRRTGLHTTDDAFLANTSNLFVTQPRFITDPAVLQRGVYTEHVNRCLAHNSGVLAANDYRGTPVIAVYRWMPERQLCLIVKLDQAEAYASSTAFGQTLGWIALTTLALASLLGFGLARTITTSLRVLQDHVVRFGHGDRDVRMPELTGDEIGVLAYEFNRTAVLLAEKETRLRSHAAQLEEMVEQRTQSLSASEYNYRSILEQASDGVFIANAEGRYIEVNQAGCAMLGFTREELLTKRINDLIAPQDLTAAPPRLEELRQGKILLTERRLMRKDGSLVPVEISARMFPDGRFQSIVRDITERKQAEDALRQYTAKLEDAENHASLGSWEFDVTSRQGWWSKQMYRMFNLEVSDIVPDFETYLERIHPEDRTIVQDVLNKMSQGVEPLSQEFRSNSQYGPMRYFAPTVYTQRDVHGRPLKFIGTQLDITERKQAENQIRRLNQELEQRVIERTAALGVSEERYRTLFESMDEGFCIIEMVFNKQEKPVDYRFLEINPSFEKQTGLIDAKGKSMRGLAPNHEEYWFEIYGNIALTGEPARFENRAEELQRWFDVYAFRFGQLESRQVAILFSDITERKQAEETIRQANAQLESANKELEAFSYSVSHDLRAPLRAISGYTNILVEDYAPSLDAEGRRVCSVISNEAQRMGKLIDDLLAFSRLNRRDLQYLKIDMQTLIQAVFNELTSLESRERIDFTLGDLPSAMGDPAMIQQVWVNLLSNALKFTSGKERAVIEVGSTQDNDEIIYFMRDNGAGFDMQYADKLFGVFQRLHSESEFEGTGVGLAIVKRVILRHGGRVWGEGQMDKGAVFYFALPGKEESYE